MKFTVIDLSCRCSELIKDEYGETMHKKAEVIHACNYCSQSLERTEQL